MMHQIITDPEQVATVINSVGTEGNIYQIIPFRRYDTDLFLILWEDHYSTSSIAYGDRGEPKPGANNGYQPLTGPSTPPSPPKTGSNAIKGK